MHLSDERLSDSHYCVPARGWHDTYHGLRLLAIFLDFSGIVDSSYVTITAF